MRWRGSRACEMNLYWGLPLDLQIVAPLRYASLV